MATLTPLTVGNAATPTGQWASAPNGALGDNSDATFGTVETNVTGTFDQGWELANVDADFATMDTLAVVLRYRWTATPNGLTTWDTLGVRIMSGATVLAAADSGGTFKTIASAITTTTLTNSASSGFTYVNTGATKTEWDAAVVEIRVAQTKSKGGDITPRAVYEADFTGTYTLSGPTTVPGSLTANAVIKVPGGTTYLVDTFTRTVASGFGTSDDGQTYTTLSGTGSVDGSRAVSDPSPDFVHQLSSRSGAGPYMEALYRVASKASPVTFGQSIRIGTRVGANGHGSGIFFWTSGMAYAAIQNGITTNYGGTAKAYAAGEYWWVRGRWGRTWATTKIWKDGDAEPSAWDFSSSLDDVDLTSDAIGIQLPTDWDDDGEQFFYVDTLYVYGPNVGIITADAVIAATQSASLTADAVILQTVSTVLPVGGGGADIVRESFTSGGDGTAQTDHTIAVPTGWGAGDTLVVAFTLNGGSLSASSGDAPNFPSITDSTGQPNPRFYMLIGTYADIGAGPWTLVSSSAVYNGYVATRYSGVDQTTPLDTAPVATNSPLGSATWSMTGLTTATNGAMLAVGMSANSSSSAVLTVDGGEPVTEYEQVWSSGAIKNTMAADGLFATAGPTGTIDGTLTSTGYAWAGVVAALRPATSGPHFIEQATGLDWSVAFASGWTEVASIPASSFVANKTYMIIVSGFLAGDDASQQFEARIAVGTTPTIPDDGTVSYDTSIGTGSVSHTPFQIVTPYTQGGTTEKVAVQVRAAVSGTASGDVWITAIRIDDELVASTDYWLDEVTADYTTTSSWAAQASVTFTPNGTDEYMVLGWASYRVGVADGTSNVNLRINDSVAGSLAVITQDGEDVTNDIRGAALMAVVTPSAASHTFSVDAGHAGTATSTVFASRLFVLRLDRFADKATVRNAGTSTALATSPSWTNVATVSKTPASTDDWLVLGYATASHATNTSTRFLWMRQQIDPDGGGLASDPAYGDDSPNQSNWKATDTHSVLFSAYPQLTAGGSRTVNLDAAISNGTGNERIFDRSIVAIPKTLGAAEAGAGITGPTMDAVITEDGGSVPGSFAANAVIAKTQSASLTANAVVAKTQTGSFTANAVIFAGVSTQTGSFSADALIVVPVWTDTFTRSGSDLGSPDLGSSYELLELEGSATANMNGSYLRVSSSGFQDWIRWIGGRGVHSGLVQFDVRFHASTATSGDDNIVTVGVGPSTLTARWNDATGEWRATTGLATAVNDGELGGTWYTYKAWVSSSTGDWDRVKFWPVGSPEADWGDSVQLGSDKAPGTGLLSVDITSDLNTDIDNILVLMADGPSWTMGQIAADAVILASSGTKTFAADAVILGGKTDSFTANSWIINHVDETFTGSAWVVDVATGSFPADAIALRATTETFSAQAWIFGSDTFAFSGDAVLVRSQSGSAAADAVVRRGFIASLTADAIILRTVASSITSNAITKATTSAAFGVDAVLRRAQTAATTADALVLRGSVGSFSASAITRKNVSGSFTSDAIAGKPVAASFSANAVVSKAGSGSLTAEAVVLLVKSGSLATDAWIVSRVEASFTGSAWVVDVAAGSLAADAIVLLEAIDAISARAWIFGSGTFAFSADAVLFAGKAGDYAADAVVIRTAPFVFDADSLVLKVQQSSLTVDAVVKRSITTAFTADAFIFGSKTDTFFADAIIGKTAVGSFAVDAIIARTRSGSLVSDAVISKTQSATLTFDATVLRGQLFSWTGDAITRLEQSGSLSANAIILGVEEQAFSADAVVGGQSSGSFSANAVINSVSQCIWTTPGSTTQISEAEALAFTMPQAAAGNMHFEIQIDTVETFDGGDLRIIKSHSDLSGWEYFDGGAWQPIPQGGVPDTYCGNEARYTIQTPLTNGTWYRRVRAGVI